MSGRACVLIAIEEEEAATRELVHSILQRPESDITPALDDEFKVLADDLDAIKARVLELDAKVQSL